MKVINKTTEHKLHVAINTKNLQLHEIILNLN